VAKRYLEKPKRIGRKLGRTTKVEITEEQRANLTKDSKGFIPSSLHYGCGAGWYEIIRTVGAYAGHHLNRWKEVNGIQERLKAKGEFNEKDHGWTSEYLTQNPIDPAILTVAVQIKEKFGGLRIYYNGSDPYIDGLIAMAESFSFRTCEVCGKEGKSRACGGYAYTSCDEHKYKNDKD